MDQPRRIAETLEDLPTLQQMLSMSGLEFMQAIANGDIAGPPIAQTLGYTVTLVEEGKVIFTGTPEFKTLNPLGTVHGGWYGTVLDSCMACAVQTMVPKGSTYTTLEYKINIIRALPLGTQVDCTGLTDHVGRSTGVAHGEIRGIGDGRLYATGSTTCIVMDMNL